MPRKTPCASLSFCFSLFPLLLEKLFVLSHGVVCPRAKRYERLMKFHGLYQPASGARETLKPANAKESKSPAPIPPITKATENPTVSHSSPTKRARKSYKGFDGESCNLAMDDDEGLIPIGAGEIKAEKVAPTVVKEESQAGYHGVTGFQYPLAEGGGGTIGEECADMLSDFLQPEDFEPLNGSDSDAFDGLGHGLPDMERRPSGSGSAMEGSFCIID